MIVAVTMQALGWVSVVWLVTVHVLIQRGRLPRDGRAYRIAGCAAAASVVAASAAEFIWPVAVLGLLWLRIEVFGHRHHAPDRQVASRMPTKARIPVQTQTQTQTPAPARMPELIAGALAHGAERAREAQSHPHAPRPQLPHPHIPHPHIPHPHLDTRTVDRVFRIEMGIVIVIAVVLFGLWAQEQWQGFRHDTDKVVCSWIDGC